jgi:alditol oxidase
MKNWAGNVTYGASAWHAPESLEQLQELVAQTPKIRAVGTRHSFSRVADTDGGALVSLESFQQMALDTASQTVTIGAGVRYGELGQFLHKRGYALPNLASLPHINVVGAVTTATHGSGNRNGNLATSVRAIERVNASGVLERLSGAALESQLVSLGLLGIVTSVTLAIEPTYHVMQYVYEGVSLETLMADFEKIFASAYSVSVFTDWASEQCAVWLKRYSLLPAPQPPFGGTLADGPRHPLPGMDPVNCTDQQGILGPWHLRLPHFQLEFTPSKGDELQSEFFVPRKSAPEAIAAIHALREKIAPLLFISELRTVAADNLWLSPHYQRDSLGIHFTWKPDWPAVRTVLPAIEAALAPFDARPHWGKLYTQVPSHLPKRADFDALRRQIDPADKFSNTFLA